MNEKSSKSKADNRLVHLCTGSHTAKFPFYDPDSPSAGYDFVGDCMSMGFPVLFHGPNIYIWSVESKK